MSQATVFPDKDRRGANRSSSRLKAYLLTSEGQLHGTATNLSRSGVFLELPPRSSWLVGETARLVFALGDGGVVRLTRYSVMIVRETKHGLGVAFWRSIRVPGYGSR